MKNWYIVHLFDLNQKHFKIAVALLKVIPFLKPPVTNPIKAHPVLRFMLEKGILNLTAETDLKRSAGLAALPVDEEVAIVPILQRP